ncbi:hypothetical protein QCA50_007900 [Cerrena zonata]|uniref:Uncharacterized protein n=1 Tax=Cerrena zonata TaxID=2478898 RepID=A0AAW0GCY6_9APHY
MLEAKAAEQKKKEIIGPQEFFERRTAANAKRDLSKISGERLATMRERGRRLFAKSKVFVWEEIEVEPWFVRKPVPKADKEAVFQEYQPNQQNYDMFTDEWDLFDNVAPIEDAEDDYNAAELVPNEFPQVPLPQQPPPQLEPITAYQDTVVPAQGEWDVQYYTRSRMEPFMYVAHYRYGIQGLPKLPLQLNVAADAFPISAGTTLLLRAMAQDAAAKEFEFRDPRLIQCLEDFWQAITSGQQMPLAISDCHMNSEAFKNKYNRWGHIIRPSFTLGDKLHTPISTTSSTACGWTLAMSCQTSFKEMLRRGWGPSNEQIIRELMERGIGFNILWTKEPTSPSAMSFVPHMYQPPIRAANYVFTDEDYKTYIGRRLDILSDPAVARYALAEGGITWRLALESRVSLANIANVDTEDTVCAYQRIEVAPQTYRYYEFVDTGIMESICGVYRVYTGHGRDQTADVSWWPKSATWQASGLGIEHWTIQCEIWFTNRLQQIREGKAKPYKVKEWQRNLKFNRKLTGRLHASMDQVPYQPIGELLLMIARNLLLTGDKHDLLSFVLTCHIFLGPGLDVLWEKIDSPHLLLSIFPGNSISLTRSVVSGAVEEDNEDDEQDNEDDEQDNKEDEEDNEDDEEDTEDYEDEECVIYEYTYKYDIHGIPAPEVWTRLLFYSRRIREISYKSDYCQPFLAQILSNKPSDVNLFPILQKLSWKSKSKEDWPSLSIFLSPSLSSLTVFCPAVDQALNLSTTIPGCLPNLRRFKLKHPELTLGYPQFELIGNALLSFKRLTYLNLNFPSISIAMDFRVLISLSQTPNLTELALGLSVEYFNYPGIVLVDGFRSLEVLRLIWWDKTSTATVIALLKTIVSPTFIHLNLYPPADMDPTDFYPLFKFTAIHRALIRLELSCSYQIKDTSPPEYLILRPDVASLQPLFSLPKLEEVFLTGFYIAFTAPLLETMAVSWPQLTTLIVNQLCQLDEPQVDILHLQPLATHCHHLKELLIPFISPHITLDTIPPSTIRPTSTERLCIFENWTKVSNHFIAIAILHAMFGVFHMLLENEGRCGKLGLAAKEFMVT